MGVSDPNMMPHVKGNQNQPLKLRSFSRNFCVKPLDGWCVKPLDGWRIPDLLGRLGGEEFTVLLPHTSRSAAFGVAKSSGDRFSWGSAAGCVVDPCPNKLNLVIRADDLESECQVRWRTDRHIEFDYLAYL